MRTGSTYLSEARSDAPVDAPLLLELDEKATGSLRVMSGIVAKTGMARFMNCSSVTKHLPRLGAGSVRRGMVTGERTQLTRTGFWAN